MRILMVLSKPVQTDGRVIKEAQALIDVGHEVHVLEWNRHGGQDPEITGLHRHAVGEPFPKDHKTSVQDMRVWWTEATKEASRLHESSGFDSLHCHDLDTLPIGVRVKRRTQLPLVYDVHDRFAWMLHDTHGWLMALAARALERFLLRHVDHVITVNDALAGAYERRSPVSVVVNCAELGSRPTPPSPGAPILYIGTFEHRRLMPEIVDALGRKGAVAWIGGKEGCFDDVEAAAARWPSIQFLGEVPHVEVPSIIRQASVMLCPLDPSSRQMRDATATKAFDAMEGGRPVVVSRGTLTAGIIEDTGAGVAVRHDRDAFVDAAIRLQSDPARLKSMSAAGRYAAEQHWNWGSQVADLVKIHETLGKTS